jgi:predicted metal-dependent enzyme (double-stranded beta helix superfamily)
MLRPSRLTDHAPSRHPHPATRVLPSAGSAARWDIEGVPPFASPSPSSATAASPAFAAFARAADALVDDPHTVAAHLGRLLQRDDWLAPEDRLPGADTYRQHVLHVSPCRRLSIASLVWLPGQTTPIHDHVSWCVVGVYRGVEREERFDLVEDGARRWLEPAGTVYAGRGHVETLVPPHGDIHTVTAAGREMAISIHVYGADLERLGSSIDRRYDDLPVVRPDRGA